MAKSRGGLIAIAAIVVAIVALWWLRRPETNASDDAAAASSGSGGARIKATPSSMKVAHLPGRKIAGTVLLDGVPVVGATVSLISSPGPEQSTTSDASGHFDLGEQKAATYELVAERLGSTNAYTNIDLREPSPQPPHDQLRLVLHACDAAIHGTIRDASGGPIAKARVKAWIGGRGVEADDDGHYELCVPVGNANVMVDADGYARIGSSITAYGRVRRDFELVPEAILIGRVVRADDHSPVAGAWIKLAHDSAVRGSFSHAHGTSDDDGKFRIDGLVPGRYSLTATAERLATQEQMTVVAEIGVQESIDCELAATVAIAGKIIERGGKAVVGVLVQFSSRSAGRWISRDARSQADGTFEVEGVFPGEYRSFIRGYEHPETTVIVESQDKRDVVLEVEAGASIAGRVVHRGKPVDDAVVSTERASSGTDVDGRFVLRGVEIGDREIYAESKRLGAFARSKKIPIGKGEQRIGVELELDLSGSIEGIVVDQAGKPVGGVSLELSLLRGRDFGAATTAEDGTFRVAALSGGGDYGYLVRSLDGSLTFPPVEGKRFPPIAVRDGQARVTGVRIAIRYERLSIAGRVVNDKGAPVPDALVRSEPSKRGGWDAPSTRTAVDGTFTIRDLPAGTYTLHASAARASLAVDNIAAGRRDIVITLPEPGAIAGEVENFTGTVFVVAFRDADRSSSYRTSTTNGSFQLRDVSPGEYRVMATTTAGESEWAKVTVNSGAATTVALRARGFGVVVATVVDDVGKPMPGMSCEVMRSRDITTDANGQFRAPKVPAGESQIWCYKPSTGSTASTQLTIVAGETNEVRLTAIHPKRPRRGEAGFETEYQLEEFRVKSVAPGGPAARAGLAVGDILIKVNESSARDVGDIEELGAGAIVKLAIERDDKPRTITLTLD